MSAGYVLASQADRIVLPRTGAVGSIGVVVMHADLSGQLSDAGVTVTLIHSGAHKVDGVDTFKNNELTVFKISQLRHVMGMRMPRPMALLNASLAEKRVAK